jgi:hypothetical protein
VKGDKKMARKKTDGMIAVEPKRLMMYPPGQNIQRIHPTSAKERRQTDAQPGKNDKIFLWAEHEIRAPRAKKKSVPHFGKRIFSSPGHGMRFPFSPYLNFFTASGDGEEGNTLDFHCFVRRPSAIR